MNYFSLKQSDKDLRLLQRSRASHVHLGPLFKSIWPKSPNPFGSLPIIEVSCRCPESQNNLPNFQNVDEILCISFSFFFSPIFLVFHVDFFLKSQEKLLAVRT